MSAHFAIPATTFVLRAILEARLKAAYGAFTPAKVSVEPPPRPPTANGAPAEVAGLILYLHHVGPNPAWRSMYDPHVNSAGERYANAPLVLDLQYMLAAQGLDLEREAVLGVGMSAFHRNAIVPRPMISALLGAVAVPPVPTKLMDTLTTEPLQDPANQPESITISQLPVDIDQSTKLWSALQSPHRPCAFFLATTVFLDTGDIYPDGKLVDDAVVAVRPTADPLAPPVDDAVVHVTEPLP